MSLVFKKSKRVLALPGERTDLPAPELPSWRKQAENFAEAVARNARSVSNGNPVKVTDETKAKRQAICAECKFNFENRCAHPRCGCPTTKRRLLLLKTELFAEFCPDFKWSAGEFLPTPEPNAVPDPGTNPTP